MSAIPITKGILFDAPTTNQDGSAIPAGEITKYQLGIGTTSGNYTTIIDDVDFTPDTATGKQIIPKSALSALQAGVPYFAAVRAVSVGGASPWSMEVQFIIALPIPSPPVGLQVV